MKVKRLALAALLVTVSVIVLTSGREGISGGREGNGGDHVRGTFIRMGLAVVRYLHDTAEGVEMAMVNGLNPGQLRSVLTIDKIKVVGGELRDNGDSAVDATGAVGMITLAKNIWLDHFEKERDVYYLVFHEMLRSLGINDDNYVISRSIQPFPGVQRVVTRLNPIYPLIIGDLLQPLVPLRSAKVSGNGCRTLNRGHANGTYLDFDAERNIIEVTPHEFSVTARRPMMTTDAPEKRCEISLPFAPTSNTRIVVAQLDVNARIGVPPNAFVRLHAFIKDGESSHIFGMRDIRGYKEGKFGRVLLRHPDVYKSPCGKSSNIIIDLWGVANSPNAQPSFLHVDKVSLFLRRETCDNEQS